MFEKILVTDMLRFCENYPTIIIKMYLTIIIEVINAKSAQLILFYLLPQRKKN